MNFARNRLFLAAAAAAATALALAGCGGGSDSPDGSNPGTGTAPPGTAPPGTAAVPPAPVIEFGIPVSYSPGSAQHLVLQSFNTAITHCGYVAMAPVQDLTVAAQGHSAYIAARGFQNTHVQTPGTPGFTGETIADRVRNAGASEARARAASEGAGTAIGFIGKAAVNLLFAPYHQVGALSQWTEIGVGTSSPQLDLTGDAIGLVLNYGGEMLNTVPRNDVRTFPCEGSTEILVNGGPEIPDPFPGLNGDFGPALNFETNKEGKIVVDSVSLRNEATGAMIELMEVKGFNLENQSWRSVHTSRGHLADATSYRVEARGKTFATTNGNDSPVAWTRNYSFKTF